MHHSKAVLAITAVLFFLSLFMLFSLNRRLLPEEDQHAVLIEATYQPGTAAPFIESQTRPWEVLFQREDIHFVFSQVGKKPGAFFDYEDRKPNKSSIYLKSESTLTSLEMLNLARSAVMPGREVQYNYIAEQTALEQLVGQQGLRIDLNISGPDLAVLDTLAGEIYRDISCWEEPVINGTNFFERYPALAAFIDAETALLHNISPQQISQALKVNLGGIITTEFRDFDKKIPVIFRSPQELHTDLNQLLQQSVGQSGYPIGAFIRLENDQFLSAIERVNQSRTFSIFLATESIGVNTLVSRLKGLVNGLNLPPGYQVQIGGAWQETLRSLKQLILAFLLSMVLVFLLLAAQFESFRIPLVIMFTVPLAFLGIAPLMLFTGQTLNIMSAIGLVVVVGVVVNDGIVKIDFIERARRQGKALNEAIHYAGQVRLRPILMTTVTTVFGLLPLALGIGSGARLQQPMAIVIIGGISTATLLTLFVLPLIYIRLAGTEKKSE
jgi:HAE1 family hydrophobic/amphiphilic exporter-1